MKMKRYIMCLALILSALTLAACQETPAFRQIIAMDTAMSFTVYGKSGDEVVQAEIEEVQRLEKLLSKTDEESAVSRLNHAGGEMAEVGSEVCELLEAAQTYSAATGGALDITIAPVVSAWGFTQAQYRVPSQEELEQLMAHVGMENLTVSGGSARLAPSSEIDLGAIAKGYASDRLAEIFREYDVERGWVSLGGNVLAWGSRPDGQPWQIGIQDPKHPDQEILVGTVGLESGYAVTSGSYQRFFEEDGKRYHHIIDPATGYPADSGLTSITVVADTQQDRNGTMCDALSTALFVMGEEKALEFWRSGLYPIELVLVTTDDRVVITQGLADQFTQAEGSGYTYETVS